MPPADCSTQARAEESAADNWIPAADSYSQAVVESWMTVDYCRSIAGNCSAAGSWRQVVDNWIPAADRWNLLVDCRRAVSQSCSGLASEPRGCYPNWNR